MTSAKPTYGQCQSCGRKGIRVRDDGTLGKHRTRYIGRETVPCDGDAPAPRRTVTVQFEVTVPAGWGHTTVARWARSLLSTELLGDDATAVRVEVRA
jgi:hypothetical protein